MKSEVLFSPSASSLNIDCVLKAIDNLFLQCEDNEDKEVEQSPPRHSLFETHPQPRGREVEYRPNSVEYSRHLSSEHSRHLSSDRQSARTLEDDEQPLHSYGTRTPALTPTASNLSNPPVCCYVARLTAKLVRNARNVLTISCNKDLKLLLTRYILYIYIIYNK